MTTLYLAWQDHKSRQWFPVGQLDTDRSTQPRTYEFSYISGAEDARKAAHFFPIVGFPELHERYRSDELFPLFQNRVMNARRPDRPEYLRRLGLGVTTDAVTELAMSSGLKHTDNFQVFLPLIAGHDGRFTYRCMAHGLRHRKPDAIRRTESLEPGEELELSAQTDNPEAALAIMVCTRDGYHIGWLPRYLVDDLQEDGDWVISDAKATVVQVNHDAPLSHRLLIDFSGKLPPGFRMADLPQYQPIARRTAPTPQTNPPAGTPTPCNWARPPRCSPSSPPPRCKSRKPGCG